MVVEIISCINLQKKLLCILIELMVTLMNDLSRWMVDSANDDVLRGLGVGFGGRRRPVCDGQPASMLMSHVHVCPQVCE